MAAIRVKTTKNCRPFVYNHDLLIYISWKVKISKCFYLSYLFCPRGLFLFCRPFFAGCFLTTSFPQSIHHNALQQTQENDRKTNHKVPIHPFDVTHLGHTHSPEITPCKAIRIPESGKFWLVKYGILGFGIRNTAQEIRNPAYDWNTESKIY